MQEGRYRDFVIENGEYEYKNCKKINTQRIFSRLNGESLSIVIPTYNREKTIRDAIKSVLNQTCLPDEIIVVDDGSIDKTVDIVQEMVGESSEVKIICHCQKNAGAQVARNKGIELASGDWIAFLDSDDLWLPDKLEQQAKALQKVGYDKNTVVHGNCVTLNQKTGEKNIWNLPLTEGENAYVELLERPAPMFQAMLTTKSALIEAGMLDEKVPAFQEWDTSIKLAKRCRFIHIQKPLFEYIVHDTVFRNPRRDLDGYEYIVKKYENEIIKQCGYDVWRKHIENLVKKCIKVSAYDRARDWIKKIPDSFRAYRYILTSIVFFRGKGLVLLRVYDIYKKDGVKGIIKKILKRCGIYDNRRDKT